MRAPGVDLELPESVDAKLNMAALLATKVRMLYDQIESTERDQMLDDIVTLVFHAQAHSLQEERLSRNIDPDFCGLALEGCRAFYANLGYKDPHQAPDNIGYSQMTAWEAAARHIFSKLNNSKVSASSWAGWKRSE